MNHRKFTKVVFILADSSIETIPPSLQEDPIVIKNALKRRKEPGEIILDSLYHYKAINRSKLPHKEKRGRPDILHRALLLLLDSQLVKFGYVDIYIHTINGHIIWVNPHVRLPRHYRRFIGLMEKLFDKGLIIDAHSGKKLLELMPININELMHIYTPYFSIGFSRHGSTIRHLDYFIRSVIREATIRKKAIINIVGCFPSGFFSMQIRKKINKLIAISKKPMTTSYVLCKVINAYEHNLLLD